MPGPLEGVLVVDLTRVLAGPFATMMMADLGARVIKVERPGAGDDSRGYGPYVEGRSMYFARVNRGKESVALDLKDPADRSVLDELVDRADVLVENFRPGVMDRLGLGPETLRARNPGLVYCSISGFGQTGPLRGRQAYDTVVQAASGLMSVTGFPGGPPVKPGAPFGDLSAALYAFGAVCAALVDRHRTGRGARIDIAMFDCLVSLVEGAGLYWLADGTDPGPIGNAHYSITPFDAFSAADRQIIICAANDELFGRLLEAMGREDLAELPQYASNVSRTQHRDLLKDELERTLRERPADDWLALLTRAGVPCGPISTIAEALGSEQTEQRHMVVTVDGWRQPGNPMKSDRTQEPVGSGPAPDLDEQGAALRREFARPAQ